MRTYSSELCFLVTAQLFAANILIIQARHESSPGHLKSHAVNSTGIKKHPQPVLPSASVPQIRSTLLRRIERIHFFRIKKVT